MTKGYDTAKERRAKAGRWTGVLVDLYREINLPPRTFQDVLLRRGVIEKC